MKKLLILAGMALVLACGVPRATAGIGITTNSTPLNVSIVVTTNGPEVFYAFQDADVFTTGQAKIKNSTLLNIFAHWAGVGSWPTGAKLVLGWDEEWNGHPLVVDKTGTNVLFDADNTGTTNAYFYVHYQEHEGAALEATGEKDSGPGFRTYIDYDYGGFALYDKNVYVSNTYLYGYGNTTDHFMQNWDKNGNDTTWSLTKDMKSAGYADSTESWSDDFGCQVSGSFDSSGSGKGANTYWDP